MTRQTGLITFALLVSSILGLSTTATAQDTQGFDRIYIGTAECVLRSGSGTPEAAVVGSVCDTYLRTDGSGELYKKTSGSGNTGWSLIPRVDAANTWLTQQTISVPSTPIFEMQETGATTNNKNWRFMITGEVFYFQTVNDAGTSTTNLFGMTRAGTMTIPGLVVSGSLITGASSATTLSAGTAPGSITPGDVSSARSSSTGAMFFGSDGAGYLERAAGPVFNLVGAPLTLTGETISAAEPVLNFYESDGGTNAKYLRFDLNTAVLRLQKLSDAYSSPVDMLSIDRATNAWDLNGGTLVGSVLNASTGYRLAGAAASGTFLRGDGTNFTTSTLTLPNAATTGAILIATGTNAIGSLTDVSVGSYLRSGGTSTAPLWSTLILPNAATANRVVYATATNTLGESASLTFNGTDLGVGGDILPITAFTTNLGAATNQLKTVHAAELWVQTITQANVTAVSGGRWVIPKNTVELAADLTNVATTISVNSNALANGDRVWMEGNGKLEFMAIASASSGSGPYTYTVTRNLDGSGANVWSAGDAMINTGTTGDGFIDAYASTGILSGSGPTIVGNVRTGTTYSNIAPRWAIGNLNGLYSYVATTYGAAFGDSSNTWMAIDATNGLRGMSGSTVRFQIAANGSGRLANGNFVWDASGNVTIGSGTAIGGWTIGSSTITGGSVTIDSAGNVRAGQTAYNTGTGFWLGVDTGTPKLSVGSSTKGFTWDGSAFVVNAPDITLGSASTFTSSAALKFARDTTFDANQIYGLWGQGSGSSYQDLTLENYASRNGIGNAKATVYIRATGWASPSTAQTPAEIKLLSDVGTNLARITLTASQVYASTAVVNLGTDFTTGYTQANATFVGSNNTEALGISGSTITNTNWYVNGVAARKATWQVTTGGTQGGIVVLYVKPDSASDVAEALRFTQTGAATLQQSLKIGAGLDATSYTTTNSSWILTNSSESLGLVGNASGMNLNMYVGGIAARKATIQVLVGGTLGGNLVFFTKPDSASDVAERMRIYQDGGVNLAGATGGSKGNGTLNVAAGLYLNGTAYNNPDFVFEQWATGRVDRFAQNVKNMGIDYRGAMPLADVEAFAREHYELPMMAQRKDRDLFLGGELLMGAVEEAYLYLFDHDARIARLEAEVARLKAKEQP